MRDRRTTGPAARAGQAAPADHAAQPGRRAFLRRAGVTGALAAGLAGGADLLGMSAAGAATRQRGGRRAKPSCIGYNCTLDYGACGRPCTPSGHCCYRCVGLGRDFTTCADTCAPSFYKCA